MAASIVFTEQSHKDVIYGALTGRKTVKELADATNLTECEVARKLQTLRRFKLVSRVLVNTSMFQPGVGGKTAVWERL